MVSSERVRTLRRHFGDKGTAALLGVSEAEIHASVLESTDIEQDEGPVTSVAGQTGDVVLAKDDVGLANVDNTADSAKPVSTATQTALDALTKADVGLGSVDNTSDAGKPISTATQTALDAIDARLDILEA